MKNEFKRSSWGHYRSKNIYARRKRFLLQCARHLPVKLVSKKAASELITYLYCSDNMERWEFH